MFDGHPNVPAPAPTFTESDRVRVIVQNWHAAAGITDNHSRRAGNANDQQIITETVASIHDTDDYSTIPVSRGFDAMMRIMARGGTIQAEAFECIIKAHAAKFPEDTRTITKAFEEIAGVIPESARCTRGFLHRMIKRHNIDHNV